MIKRILKVLSLVLAVALFVSFTQEYFFRVNKRDDIRMQGFRMEEKDSLDVVLLGSSEIYSGFASAYAYELEGFTSYPYAVAAAPVTLWKTMLEDVLSRQDPQLIVVEVNGVVYFDPQRQYNNAATHYVLDGMPLSGQKVRAVNENVKDFNDDKLCFYLPFVKYHSNWQNLDDLVGVYGNVSTMNKRGFSLLKGVSSTSFIQKPGTEILDLSSDFSEEPISEESERCLREFLDFCREKELNVLFTRFPHQFRADDGVVYNCFKMTNRAERIIQEYGFPFLNCERILDEIGIDPQEDFYNENHLNIYGQLKLTQFFARYLTDECGVVPRAQSEKQQARWRESAEYYALYARYMEGLIEEGTKYTASETKGLINKLIKMKES